MMALTDVPKDFRYILSIMELDQFFRLFETSLLGTEAFSIGAEVSSAGAGDSPAGGGGVVEDLQVLELAATKPKSQVRKSQKQLAAERDARVELFVRYVAPGMAYLYVLDALAKGKMKKFSIKQLSKASRQKAGQVSTVVGHLCELRICEVHGKGKFQYSPGQAAAEDVDDFLRMWNNPNNHSKVYKWVYQEEQELKKKTKSFTSKIKRRLFGK